MTDKVHGFVGRAWNGKVDNSSMALTGSLDIFTLRTTIDIMPTGVAAYTNSGNASNYADVRKQDSQYVLDKIIEIISTRGQPVVLTNVVKSTESSPSDLPAASGSVTVYSFKFMIEHAASWFDNNGKLMLPDVLNGVAGLVYTTPTTKNNVAVTLDNEFKSTIDETGGKDTYIF